MNKRTIAAVAIVLVAAATLFTRSPDDTPEIEENIPVNQEEAESRLEEVLGKTLPDNAQRLTLTKDSQSAVVARSEEDGFVNFTVLADLDKTDQVYQVWVGPNADELRGLGNLITAKGGYLFESRQSGNITDYNHVAIKLGEESILEGSY